MEKISLVIVEAGEASGKSLREFFENCDDIDILDTATDGATGAEKICALKPDAVILGVVLPGIDGFAVMERISASGLKPSIIVYSAFSTESFVSKALNLGADYYMVKPCDLGMLKERLFDAHYSRKTAKDKYRKEFAIPAQPLRTERSYKSKSLEERITNIFISVGIPPHIKGYGYLREAVKMAVDEPDIINSITKKLYPSIAGRFDTSASKVERAIRHAIEVAWNRGKMENVNSLFGIKIYSNNEKPTNGEFIALIADKMLLEGA